jgi:raffinose/stachyose/melibiose transport system substrate-binding protein
MNRTLKKHTRHVVAAASVLGLGATLLVGCSGAEKDETIKLTMAMMNTYEPGFEQLIADFREIRPDVTIEPSYYAADIYAQTVPTQFAGGSGSDLVYVDAGTGVQSVKRMVEAGHLLDLSDQGWVDSLYPATAPGYQDDGKTYGRDFGISALAVLMYDKDYFADKGFSVPEQFDGLLDLCEAIAADGLIPISMAGSSAGVDWNDVVSIAGNTVMGPDPTWLERRVAGDVTFADTEGWVAALDQLQAMKDAKCFSPGMASVNINQMLTDLGSRQAAMMFTYGGLVAPVLDQTPDMNAGMFPPPPAKGGETWLTVQASGGIGVWSKTKHAEAAKAFIDFVSQEDNIRFLADSNVLISPPDATEGNIPDAYAELAPYFESGKVINALVTEVPDSIKLEDGAGSAVQGLLSDQMDVNEVLEAIDFSFNRTLEE